MTETDPATGKKWPDRYGKAFGKGFTHTGNIEPYLSYRKLHRTGKLLRSLSTRVQYGSEIVLSAAAEYASEHELGGASGGAVIKEPYVQGGARGVLVGGQIHARPFMRPSKQVLRAPASLIEDRMRQYGWIGG